jgi:hypothetical protein
MYPTLERLGEEKFTYCMVQDMDDIIEKREISIDQPALVVALQTKHHRLVQSAVSIAI